MAGTLRGRELVLFNWDRASTAFLSPSWIPVPAPHQNGHLLIAWGGCWRPGEPAGFGFSALAARTPLARPLTGRSEVSWSTLLPRWRTSSFALTPSIDDGPLDLTETD